MRHSAIFAGTYFLIILISAHLSWASDRKTYSVDIPAIGVRAINFDVQEGEFVLRGDPTAKSVNIRVAVDRWQLGPGRIPHRLRSGRAGRHPVTGARHLGNYSHLVGQCADRCARWKRDLDHL